MLDPNDSLSIQELARGTAKVVAETKLVDTEIVKQWSEQRAQSQQCQIGNDDVFATYKKLKLAYSRILSLFYHLQTGHNEFLQRRSYQSLRLLAVRR